MAGDKWQWLQPRHIVIVFLLLVAVDVFAPFHADDYFQQLLLRGDTLLKRGDDGSLFGLFSFVDDDAQNRRQMQKLGVLPWFAAENFYFRFWRPVAEITHWLDYRLFAESPAWAHFHNILWLLLLSGVVYCLARETLPQDKKLLWLVLAVFMLDGQHVATIHWVANRNALIAAVFSLTTLLCHIRWRQSQQFLWLAPALLSLALGLLSSESAVAVFFYLFFYAVMLDGGRLRTALAALVPYVLLGLAWLLVYRHLGFGTGEAGGLYINPFSQPVEFARAVLERLPVYLTAALLPMPAGLSWGGGQWLGWLSPLVTVFSTGFAVFSLWYLWPWLKADRRLRFWFAGGVLAVLPACATLAQDRLALMQTVGIDIAIALVIYDVLCRAEKWRGIKRPLKKQLPAILLVIHLILSPLHLLAGSVYMTAATTMVRDKARQFAGADELAGRDLLVLSMPIGEATSLMGIRRFYGDAMPASFIWLASDESPVVAKRLGERVLLVEKPAGFVTGHETAFGMNRFSEGERITIGPWQIRVMTINKQGRPVRLRLSYGGDRPVDRLLVTAGDNGSLKAGSKPEP